jgi:hypothetical protein
MVAATTLGSMRVRIAFEPIEGSAKIGEVGTGSVAAATKAHYKAGLKGRFWLSRPCHRRESEEEEGDGDSQILSRWKGGGQWRRVEALLKWVSVETSRRSINSAFLQPFGLHRLWLGFTLIVVLWLHTAGGLKRTHFSQRKNCPFNVLPTGPAHFVVLALHLLSLSQFVCKYMRPTYAENVLCICIFLFFHCSALLAGLVAHVKGDRRRKLSAIPLEKEPFEEKEGCGCCPSRKRARVPSACELNLSRTPSLAPCSSLTPLSRLDSSRPSSPLCRTPAVHILSC